METEWSPGGGEGGGEVRDFGVKEQEAGATRPTLTAA